MPDLDFHNKHDYKDHREDVKIAHITFAYDNALIIELLKERGDYIKQEEWAKMRVLNKQIPEYIKSDKAFCAKLQNPCSVFVTFESEEGQRRACEYSDAVAGKKGSAYEHMK